MPNLFRVPVPVPVPVPVDPVRRPVEAEEGDPLRPERRLAPLLDGAPAEARLPMHVESANQIVAFIGIDPSDRTIRPREALPMES